MVFFQCLKPQSGQKFYIIPNWYSFLNSHWSDIIKDLIKDLFIDIGQPEQINTMKESTGTQIQLLLKLWTNELIKSHTRTF